MPRSVKCPSCSTVLGIPDTMAAGGAVRCPKCATVLRVPASQPSAPAATAPRPADTTAPPAAAPRRSEQTTRRPAPKAPPPEPVADEIYEDEDRPVARPKSKKGLFIGLGVGAFILFMCCGGISFGVYRLVKGTKEAINQLGDDLAKQMKAPEKKTFDVSNIHADCTGVIVLQPTRILKSKSPLLPTPDKQEKLLGPAGNPAGIDFRKVDQIVVVLEPAPPGKAQRQPPARQPRPGRPMQPAPKADDEPVRVGFILRFADPVATTSMIEKTLPGVEPVQAEGKTYYRSRLDKSGGEFMAGAVEGDRTLLLAPDPMLKKMLAARDLHTPLTEKLRSFDLENDAFGVFLAEPMRPALKEMTNDPNMEKQFPTAKTLDDDLVAITMIANLDSDKLLQVTLQGKNEKAAGNIEQFLDGVLAFVKLIYPQFKPAMQAQLPPELAAPIFKVTDQLQKKDGITMTKEGSNVVLTLNKPKDQ